MAESEEGKYGFEREEMYKGELGGTVDVYGRHVFLCYKTYDTWPAKIESSESDLLPYLLFRALKNQKDNIALKTRLTVCEGIEGTEFVDGDVLIFPEMIKYRGLKESDVDGFVEDVIVKGKPWASGVPEVLAGSHVFVCAHASRDMRCGVCGPALIEKFKEEIDSRGLKDQVFVSGCSHVGGHKYAGNLIIFSADAEGKIAGHWYGYAKPDDVAAFLDQHIAKGEIIERLWRGLMSAPVNEAEKVEEKADEKKIPNGKHVEEAVRKPNEDTQVETESVASCCQGANAVSCCRDASPEEREASEEKETKGESKFSCLMGKWDQTDVYAAVAVVVAVATVAVAYSFYKRSG